MIDAHEVKRLFLLGKNDNEISAALKTTRNAVIGLRWRMGLKTDAQANKASPDAKPPNPSPAAAEKPKAPPLVVKPTSKHVAVILSNTRRRHDSNPNAPMHVSPKQPPLPPQRRPLDGLFPIAGTIAPRAEEAVPAPPGGGVLIMELHARSCRWPLWPHHTSPPTDEAFYCGRLTDGSSYCSGHTAMVNQPASHKRKPPPPMLSAPGGAWA